MLKNIKDASRQAFHVLTNATILSILLLANFAVMTVVLVIIELFTDVQLSNIQIHNPDGLIAIITTAGISVGLFALVTRDGLVKGTLEIIPRYMWRSVSSSDIQEWYNEKEKAHKYNRIREKYIE